MPESAATLNAEIARECARIQTRFRGRGPRRTRVIRRGDVVVVLMEDTLTTAEKSLVGDGKTDLVEQMRSEFQATMQSALVAAIERLTGARVIAFMSGSHTEPDMSVEVFVLTPGTDSGAAQ
jgi:uncharacterized protein YbcI